MLTLSLIDLSRAESLGRAVNRFFGYLTPFLDERSFSGFSRIRQDAKDFGRASTSSDYDLVDLYDLADRFADTDKLRTDGPVSPRQARAVQTELLSAVLLTTGNQARAHGLSIYLPHYNRKSFSGSWFDACRKNGRMPDYAEYLTRYGDYWNAEQMAKWDHLTGWPFPLTEAGTQRIELRLTPEQSEHFASASCLILEDDGSDSLFCNTYLLDGIELKGNRLEAEYAFDALYAVNGNGVPETEAIPFEIRDGYYLISAVLQKESILGLTAKDQKRFEEESLSVVFQCVKNEKTNELEIHNVYRVSGDGLNFGKQTVAIDPAEWPYIRFRGTARKKTEDPDGSVFPFQEWPGSPMSSFSYDATGPDGTQLRMYEWRKLFGSTLPPGYHSDAEADNTAPWKLQFRRRNATGRELAAQFIVRDTQGNEWGSGLIPLQNPDVRGRADVECEPLTFSGCTIRPYEAKTIAGDSFQGVCIRVRVESETGKNAALCMIDPAVNGICSPSEIIISGSGADTDEYIADLYVDLSHMPRRDDPEIRTISCVLFSSGAEGHYNRFSDRTELKMNLDVSALPLQPGPAGEPLDFHEEEDIQIQLTELEESEEEILKGRLRIVNRGARLRWVVVNRFREDALPAFYIEDCPVRNCAYIRNYILALPGGEGVVDFEVDGNLTQGLRALDYGEELWEADVTRIDNCGFSVMIVNDEDLIRNEDGTVSFRTRLLEKDGKTYLVQGGMSYYYRFSLPEAIILNRPIPLHYIPDYPFLTP